MFGRKHCFTLMIRMLDYPQCGEIPMPETHFSSKHRCLHTAGVNSSIKNFGTEESRFTSACFEKEYMVPHVSDIKI